MIVQLDEDNNGQVSPSPMETTSPASLESLPASPEPQDANDTAVSNSSELSTPEEPTPDTAHTPPTPAETPNPTPNPATLLASLRNNRPPR